MRVEGVAVHLDVGVDEHDHVAAGPLDAGLRAADADSDGGRFHHDDLVGPVRRPPRSAARHRGSVRRRIGRRDHHGQGQHRATLRTPALELPGPVRVAARPRRPPMSDDPPSGCAAPAASAASPGSVPLREDDGSVGGLTPVRLPLDEARPHRGQGQVELPRQRRQRGVGETRRGRSRPARTIAPPSTPAGVGDRGVEVAARSALASWRPRRHAVERADGGRRRSATTTTASGGERHDPGRHRAGTPPRAGRADAGQHAQQGRRREQEAAQRRRSRGDGHGDHDGRPRDDECGEPP